MDTQPAPTSVAAFFRDTRLAGAAPRTRPEDAADTLARFFRTYSMEACSADQLLALADLSLRAKNVEAAREALARAVQMPQKVHLAYYKLGRLELAAGNSEKAAELFCWGTEADPGFAFNWMGRARALATNSQHQAAAEQAERFVGFGVKPHAPEELATLAQLADFLFEAGERRRAGPIYAFLRQFGAEDHRTAVRLAESLISTGEAGQALALLRPLHAAGKLDSWGVRALAHCESQAGQHETALRLAEQVTAERPDDKGFADTYLNVLVLSRDPARWAHALDRPGAWLSPEARLELSVRLQVASGQAPRAAALLAEAALRPGTRLFYTAIEAAYAALDGGDPGLALNLAARLTEAAPDEVAPVLLRTDVALRQQDWAAAGEALGAVPPAHADRPDVLLKWFEYRCFMGETAEAEALRVRLMQAELPSRQFTLPMLRFLAEQQRWDELADQACAWLGADFRYDQIGYVLFRAAKRTGRHAHFLAAIEAVEDWRGRPDLARLHTTLAWDAASGLAQMEQVSTQAGGALSPAMARRMAIQRLLAARAAGGGGRRALFLCSNANYLCATVVALHSALAHSAPGREDCFVIIDDALAELTGRVVQPFRDRGFSVTVVPASEVVQDASRLYAAYGLFTSGHMLASAAYYRIFFARHLQRSGRYDRAVYIDSDVLVRTPLDSLFAADLAGNPLAARVETPRPEVSRAIALHRLQGDLYFNSGVLLFDLAHAEMAAALDGAVAAIADEGVTLLFHDQCALNLGFRDRFHRMGSEWNTPVGERTRVADLPQGAAVLHYLDRPKPWSAAYDGECAMLWLEEWRKTAELVGEAQALEVFWLVED